MSNKEAIRMLRSALAMLVTVIDCGVTTNVIKDVERDQPGASTLHHAREVLRYTKDCE